MFVAARALFELQLQRNSVTPLLVIRVANYYHLSPHIRAHVLCAGVRARYVFLSKGTRTVPFQQPSHALWLQHMAHTLVATAHT